MKKFSDIVQSNRMKKREALEDFEKQGYTTKDDGQLSHTEIMTARRSFQGKTCRMVRRKQASTVVVRGRSR